MFSSNFSPFPFYVHKKQKLDFVQYFGFFPLKDMQTPPSVWIQFSWMMGSVLYSMGKIVKKFSAIQIRVNVYKHPSNKWLLCIFLLIFYTEIWVGPWPPLMEIWNGAPEHIVKGYDTAYNTNKLKSNLFNTILIATTWMNQYGYTRAEYNFLTVVISWRIHIRI